MSTTTATQAGAEQQLPEPRPARRLRRGGRTRDGLAFVLVIVVGIVAWALISASGAFPAYALPSPADVVRAFDSLARAGFGGQSLASDIGASLFRLAAGFLLATVIGIPLGIAMGRIKWVYNAVDPLVEFFRPVPPLAYIPLLVVWFGIGETPKIVLIAVGTAPIVIINAMSGVKATPPVRLRVAQCLGASRWQMFRCVILPSALPEIFTGLRVANGVAWTCLVAAELIAAQSGLGWLVQSAGQALRVSIVIAGIILIGVLGYATELIIRFFESLLVPWKGKS
ncbi:MAG: ABC transporter permease [Marmoricola sp.]